MLMPCKAKCCGMDPHTQTMGKLEKIDEICTYFNIGQYVAENPDS